MAQTSIRLIRLVCLYAILFYLGTELALALQEIREADPGSSANEQAERLRSHPAGQIPFLGVTIALEQYDDPLQRQEALRRLSDAGFGWARLRVDWNRIEPQPGAYQWAWTDAVLADISAAGLEPVVVLDGSPPWARDSKDHPTPVTIDQKRASANDTDHSPLTIDHSSLAPPAAPETYARFAAAFADRYQDTVRFYQIWDEPNIAPHWGNRLIDPAAYARLLRAAAIAVRAADPDAAVLVAALAPTQDRGHTAIDEGYFLQRLYAAGAAPYFDAVLVQPFGFGAAPDDARSRVDVLNFRRAAWVRRVMVAAGDKQTPVWAVRFGWNRQVQVPWKTVSVDNQLRFTQEALRHARASWPWLTAIGWPVDRPDAPPSDPMWGFSLITADGQEHPLLSALSSATQAASDTPEQAIRNSGRSLLRARLALLLLAGGILLWQGVLMSRSLPLARWQAAYRRWPQGRKLAVWTLLLIIYYLAAWPPLIVLCWIVAAFLTASEPITGLMIAAAALPFHFQHKELRLVGAVWTVPPAQAALLAMLPALAQRAIRPHLWQIRRLHNAIRSTHCANQLTFAWVGVSLLTALNVWHWPGYFGGFWELVAVPVLLYAGVRLFAAQERQQRAVLTALFAGGVLAAGAGLVDWLIGGGVSVDGVRRLMGISFSPNQTALYLLRTLFVGAGLLAIREYRPRAIAVGCLLVAAALALTTSRGAIFLGLPAGALVMAAAGRWRRLSHERFRNWLPLIGLLTLAGSLALILFFGERLLNIETLSARLAIWRDAWSLWRQFLLLGVGPGGFFWNYPAFLQPSSAADPNLLHPHSVWLEYTTGWGVFGLVWLGALLCWLASILVRTRRGPPAWLPIGLLAALCAGLAHAQVDAFAALPELAAWNFAALALLEMPKEKSE